MAELLKPIMKIFDDFLETRLLPIRSISSQVLCKADCDLCSASQLRGLLAARDFPRPFGATATLQRAWHPAWLCRQTLHTA